MQKKLIDYSKKVLNNNYGFIRKRVSPWFLNAECWLNMYIYILYIYVIFIICTIIIYWLLTQITSCFEFGWAQYVLPSLYYSLYSFLFWCHWWLLCDPETTSIYLCKLLANWHLVTTNEHKLASSLSSSSFLMIVSFFKIITLTYFLTYSSSSSVVSSSFFSGKVPVSDSFELLLQNSFFACLISSLEAFWGIN